MGAGGFEPLRSSAGKTQGVDPRGSKSGNNGAGSGPPTPPAKPTDPELAAVVAAWPTLAEPVRLAIKALLSAAALPPGSPGDGR